MENSNSTPKPITSDYTQYNGIPVRDFEHLPGGGGMLSPSEYYPWTLAAFTNNPYPWYERAQNEVPVLKDIDGTYIVSKYDDVMEFGQSDYMSVEPGWDTAGPWKRVKSTVIGKDGAEHHRLRRITNKWFAPKAVREWIKETAAAADELLDTRESPELDGWLDLAVKPTHTTMCKVLQVDESDAHEVMSEMAATMPMLRARPSQEDVENASVAFTQLSNRTETFIRGQQSHPGTGLAAELIEKVRTGDMTEEECSATLLMFYSLGHMDVGYLIAAGLRVFAELPHVYQAFQSDETCRDAIINEIVRFDPPETSLYRTNSEPVAIQGTRIPAGSRIRFMLAAANRDPSHFDDPHTFNFKRPQDKSKNLSFGLGTHTCAGQGISRAQAKTVFEAVARRFASVEIDGPVLMDNTDWSRHYLSVPLRFKK